MRPWITKQCAQEYPWQSCVKEPQIRIYTNSHFLRMDTGIQVYSQNVTQRINENEKIQQY